jgi:hypothetical protein
VSALRYTTNPCDLIEVLVHGGAAEGGGTRVLLDSGLAPAAEGNEVREGGAAVIVRVPQRVLLQGAGAASDGGPLTVAGVDACTTKICNYLTFTHGPAYTRRVLTDAHTLLLALISHLLDEVHVVGLG